MASTYLTRTFTQQSRYKWTISFWLKEQIRSATNY